MVLSTKDQQVLAQLGARDASFLVGDVSQPAPMIFDIGVAASPPASATHMTAFADLAGGIRMAPEVRALLRFAYNDLYQPVLWDGLSPDLAAQLAVFGGTPPLSNANSAHLDLACVYGAPGLRGDMHRQLAYCLTSPWDPAKLRMGAGGGLPALAEVMSGPGAPLDLGYFRDLPPHLWQLFFDAEGGLRDRPFIPDRRNGCDPCTRALHAQLVSLHNQSVDAMARGEGCGQQDRVALFRVARARVTSELANAIRTHLLPALCDPLVLKAIESQCYKTYRAFTETHAPKAAVPLEAIILMEALLWQVGDEMPWLLSRALSGEAVGWAAHAKATLPAPPDDSLPFPVFLLGEMSAPSRGLLGPIGSMILAETLLGASASSDPQDVTPDPHTALPQLDLCRAAPPPSP